MESKKNIFIIIPEALLIRNILRGGTLALLKQQGHRIHIFLVCKDIPEYIKQEFEDQQVTVHAVEETMLQRNVIHKYIILFTHFLILNATTKIYFRYSRHYIHRSLLEHIWYRGLLEICGRISLFKKIIRPFEYYVFPEKNKYIASYFDTYKPDLVFSTSITSRFDNVFLKEAKRRNIKTVSMTKSWDNATKMYHRFIPDYFLVQNDRIKKALMEVQHVKESSIFVVGFPQFDWYTNASYLVSREQHLTKKGLDPTLPVIFFGSQGEWYPYDYTIAETIYEWIRDGVLCMPCQLLVRPHFSTVKTTPLQKLRGLPGVAYDDGYEVSEAFSDNWDPKIEEVADFANTMYHSSMIVNMVSTLALDAACFNKPIINVLYGGVYQNNKDVTAYLSQVVHYGWIFDTKAPTVVKNKEQLKQAINMYLKDQTIKSKERTLLRDTFCYGIDGKATEKIVQALHTILFN